MLTSGFGILSSQTESINLLPFLWVFFFFFFPCRCIPLIQGDVFKIIGFSRHSDTYCINIVWVLLLLMLLIDLPGPQRHFESTTLL